MIAIIAILAAMLLPALQSARARGRCTSCTNNLKQYGTAILIYADNYNEWMIGQEGIGDGKGGTGKIWCEYTSVFSKLLVGSENIDQDRWRHGLYINGCDEIPPSETDCGPGKDNTGYIGKHYTASATVGQWSARGYSYAINSSTMGTGYLKSGYSHTKIGKLKNPSKYIAFADSSTTNFSGSAYYGDATQGHCRLVARHLGKRAANLAMVDGHVETNTASVNGFYPSTDLEFKKKVDPRTDGQPMATWMDVF